MLTGSSSVWTKARAHLSPVLLALVFALWGLMAAAQAEEARRAKPDSPFDAVLQDWIGRGLARFWTDRFGAQEVHPQYVAPGGARSLVLDFAEGLDVVSERTVETVVRSDRDRGGDVDGDATRGGVLVDGESWDAVVLAMPDPQAARLLAPGTIPADALASADDWLATISVVLTFDERRWAADLHGLATDDSDTIDFIADDGDRRGDGAPVLVVHSAHGIAREHLDDPDAVIPAVTDAAMAALGIDIPPVRSYAHRWTFAETAAPHDEPFLLDDGVAVCGDAWGGRSSLGRAWASGDALGRELAERLG